MSHHDSEESLLWCKLPIELIYDILWKLWSSSLSSDERIWLLTSLPIVNKTWMAIFAEISMTDVYIPSPSYAYHYLRLLSMSPSDSLEWTRSLWIPATSLASPRCRSLTFQIQGDTTLFPVQLYRTTSPMGDTLSNTLYAIDRLGYLPNLRQLSIVYVNWGFDDLFDHFRLSAFPSQITHLNLTYSSIRNIPVALSQYLKSAYVRHRCPKCHLPSIRRVSIAGASTEFVADILGICPNVETLGVETTLADHLDEIVPLPSGIHTLILRNPNPELDSAPLDAVLAHGIFRCRFPSLRIVVDCGTLVKRKAARKVAKFSRSHAMQLM